MPHRSAETATYPGEMAKFEIELPDDLSVVIDNLARDAGETREQFLRRITEEGLASAKATYREKFEGLLGPPVPLGGNAAELIREMRDNHPRIRRGNVDDE